MIPSINNHWRLFEVLRQFKDRLQYNDDYTNVKVDMSLLNDVETLIRDLCSKIDSHTVPVQIDVNEVMKKECGACLFNTGAQNGRFVEISKRNETDSG